VRRRHRRIRALGHHAGVPLDPGQGRRPGGREEREPADHVDPDQDADRTAERRGGHASGDQRQVQAADQLQHLEAGRAEQRTGQQPAQRMAGGGHHLEQPQQDDDVRAEGQHDAEQGGQQGQPGCVAESPQLQQPAGGLGHQPGEPEAEQTEQAEGDQGEQVLQVVAQELRLVDVALPDVLHAHAQLVHGA